MWGATVRRGVKNPKTVYVTKKAGARVRAPRPGRLYARKGGFMVVTSSGNYRHVVTRAKLRPWVVKKLAENKRRGKPGVAVRDGKWVAASTHATVIYKRRKKVGRRWEQVAGMSVVRKPVVKPRLTHRKPWNGTYALVTGYRYRSGAAHYAWDIGCWLGTPLYAAFDGVVAGMNDGVRNNRPGYNPGSNSPSNWVLLHGRDPKGNRVTLYYQHMSPGVKVRKGQRVKCGTFLGKSGNTGNSTGPHFHVHAMKGWQWDRYRLYRDRSVIVYPPKRAWS